MLGLASEWKLAKRDRKSYSGSSELELVPEIVAVQYKNKSS